MRIAVHCDAPRWHADWSAFASAMREKVAAADSDLIVLPEYAAVEAALIGIRKPETDWFAKAAQLHADWVNLMRELARAERCHILAGSGPVLVDDKIVNRAVLAASDGSMGFQDKLIPTPWERSQQLAAGKGLQLFDTRLGKIGVAICYDAEFPLFSRALAAAGADLILVPACTDDQAGQDRVQIACRARALENQCLVVHAPMMGNVPDCDIIDQNVGEPGFFGPPDQGQPVGGIHVATHDPSDGWHRANLDIGKAKQPRETGNTRLFGDWSMQGIPDLPVELVVLGK